MRWIALFLLFTGCASAQPSLKVTYQPLKNEVLIALEIKP